MRGGGRLPTIEIVGSDLSRRVATGKRGNDDGFGWEVMRDEGLGCLLGVMLRLVVFHRCKGSQMISRVPTERFNFSPRF